MTEQAEFANDLLRGASEIADFLLGDKSLRRQVYHLAATSTLPTFKLGSMICARKSVLLKWIEEQEGRHANDNRKSASKIVGNAKV